MTTTTAPLPPPPPVLKFDEGSRQEPDETHATTTSRNFHPRQDVSVEEYYEIDRFVGEIAAIAATNATDDAMMRIAIQLPDELLSDAAELCWAFETALRGRSEDPMEYFVFVLGDTTYAPCCPDIIASQHLSAHILIHYGHACLSQVHERTNAFPRVLYSFGKQPIPVAQCVLDVVTQLHSLEPSHSIQRLLLLYEVQYAHAMTELKDSLQAARVDVAIHMGLVPNHEASEPLQKRMSSSPASSTTMDVLHHHRILVGGLELPESFYSDADDDSNCILLYIGDASSRPFLNIALRFLSDPQHRPVDIWTWSPTKRTLCTNVLAGASFQRILQRRYYLVQKAKRCSTFGILVAHMTEQIQAFVTSIREFLASHQLSYYTFVVGKINPTKLANFPEVECFIFVACPEHSLLHNERELYPIPIITPYELLVALGNSTDHEWGAVPYSTHPQEYWSIPLATDAPSMLGSTPSSVDVDGDNEDDDAPYFSLVTGGYAQKPATETTHAPLLSAATTSDALVKAPDGTLMTRTAGSAAATFFQKREYQGLVPLQPSTMLEDGNAGTDVVTTAVQGQTGIASNYGNR